MIIRLTRDINCDDLLSMNIPAKSRRTDPLGPFHPLEQNGNVNEGKTETKKSLSPRVIFNLFVGASLGHVVWRLLVA